MLTLQVTQDAADQFLAGISLEGVNGSGMGILVRQYKKTSVNIDFIITDDSCGFSTQTIKGVLFYFDTTLPDGETWEVDHDGTNYTKEKIS